MKATSKIFALAVLATLVAAGVAPAQDADTPQVHVHFRTLGVIGAGVGDVFFGSEQKDVRIQVDENVRSGFYDYKGPAALTLYRLKTNPDKSVEHVNVAEVDLTNAGEWPLLLITPGAKPSATQVVAIADDFTAFPPGSYRYINRSKGLCACVLGGENFVLTPDEVKLVNPPPPDASHHTVIAQVSLGNPRRLIYSSNWARLTGPRTLVFVNEGAGDFGVARRVVEPPDVLAAEMKKSKPK